MFEVNIVGTCGGMLSLALEEALGKGKAAVIGQGVNSMNFLEWQPKLFEDPTEFSGDEEYDFIVCLQCLEQLRGIKLINVNNNLYAVKGAELVDLTDEQERQAAAFMKKSGMKIKRGESVVLSLELNSFLDKIEKALVKNGTILVIDYGDPDVLKNLTKMQVKYQAFSRFMAGTKAGKLHVINCNPYLSKSPHIIRDSPVLNIMQRFNCENKLVPWLDIQEKLSEDEKTMLQPFIIKASSAFSGWGEIVRDYKIAAKELKRQLNDVDGVTGLYSTSFVLGNTLNSDFSEKAWMRASQIANIPERPPLFAALLHKVYK